MYLSKLIFLFFVFSSCFRGFRVMDAPIQKIPYTKFTKKGRRDYITKSMFELTLSEKKKTRTQSPLDFASSSAIRAAFSGFIRKAIAAAFSSSVITGFAKIPAISGVSGIPASRRFCLQASA